MSQSDFVSRGQALVSAGQFQEAVKVCRLGLLGSPTTVEGRLVLGQALLALNRFDEVLAEMRVALELDGAAVEAYLLRGEALLRKGDPRAATEALERAKQLSPRDPRIASLLGDAGKPVRPASASHPAVGWVSGGGETRNYPSHQAATGEEDSFTKPTSLAERISERPGALPSPAELAVGDRSGTVEVDPDLDAVEQDSDSDFDDLAAPPPGGRDGIRASIAPTPRRPSSRRALREMPGDYEPKRLEPTIDLDRGDDDSYETHLPAIESVRRPVIGSGGARNAGSSDEPVRRKGPTLPPPRGKSATAPPPLNLPAILNPPPTPQPLPPPPRMAAAMPTMSPAQPPETLHSLAVPPPSLPVPQPMGLGLPSPASMAGGGRAPMTLHAPPPPPIQPPPMFRESVPDWGALQADSRPGSDVAPPSLAPEVPSAPVNEPPAKATRKPKKTATRRARSPVHVALWVVVGASVIGGGVGAGFLIRSLRLQKQIAAARDHATDLAKADSWAGWAAARDSLANIVQAQGSVENRAALARARGLVAFEFGDGLADARTTVEGLAGQGELDGNIAAAYVALAQSDAHGAKLAADAAIVEAPQDAAALYVSGQAALLAGDLKAATTLLRSAVEREPRPLYRVGLARALVASYSWGDALEVIDRVRTTDADHPAATIERGVVLASGGRIAPGSGIGNDVRAQLDKLIAEGSRPVAEQQHGVSPEQVAFAELALARVDFARGDAAVARADVGRAGDVGVEDQSFAEEAIETLFAIGDLARAKEFADRALGVWPQSRRARTTLAQILLALGRPAEALETLDKQPEMLGAPVPQAVRGQARLAGGDVDGARADFENALKKVPGLELAVVGRAWLELDAGNVDDAKKLIEPRYNAASATPALATVYAAILRRDLVGRDKAEGILERVVGGPAGLDVARAQLELARLERDRGDLHKARAAYAEAAKAGDYQAKIETALLQIEDRDPSGGRETLDMLLREAGDRPSGRLVIETARARMLVGDHTGAVQLIETASKLPDVPKWALQRETGRLALRRTDFAGAIVALSSALDGCGDDTETFLLAADAAATGDVKGGPALADKLRKLVPLRLKNEPEASIVSGKLLIGAGQFSQALEAFTGARNALEKASSRRMAQARFGIAVANYNLKNDAQARAELDLVIGLDPSMYSAYLYLVDLLGGREQRRAFELAQKAVAYDPDAEAGWLLVGQLAAKLGDRKVLGEAITKLAALAPNSDDLKQLKALRR